MAPALEQGQPMATPSTGLPGFRRQACERCFSRKHKCDKILPSCSSCLNHNVECKNRIALLDVSNPYTNIKHSSISEYVESLKRKIGDSDAESANSSPKRRKRSETHHENINECESPETITPDLGETSERLEPNQRLNLNESQERMDRRGLSVREAMGEIGLLTGSAMAEPRSEPRKLPQNLSFYNMVTAALGLDSPDHSMSRLTDGHSLKDQFITVPNDKPLELDRRSTIIHIKMFVKHVCIRYPYLDSETCMKQYEAVVSEPSPSTQRGSNSGSVDPLDHFNTYMSIATGVLLSDDGPLFSSFVQALHTASKRLLPAIWKRGSLDTIHCMLTLAIFSLYSPSGGSSWHIIGLIMQKCIMLGLEKEPDLGGQISKLGADQRRKIFWSAYILDRSISLSMGRPFSIQDKDITVKIPAGNDGGKAIDAGIFVHEHVIHHARLSSKISSASYGALLFNYRNICFWTEAPTSLRQPTLGFKHLPIYMEQLKCRMLLQLIDSMKTERSRLSMTHSPNPLLEEIESDILATCGRFIDHCYNASDSENTHRSLVDITDVFCSGIGFAYLSIVRHGAGLGIRSKDAYEILQKCSFIITRGGGGFSATKIFQKTIIAVSSRLVGFALHQDKHSELLLKTLETVLPNRIINMVKFCLSRKFNDFW